MGKSRGKKGRRWARFLVLALLGLAVAWGALEWALWPDVEALATADPETTTFIRSYERLGKPAKRRWVSYGRISTHLKRAVLVAEDIDFFSHQGFAWDEMKAAVRDHVEKGRDLRGASTISQQVTKNLWLSSSRNPLRKIKEALLTRSLEAHLDKRRILEIYLNVVELGEGIYGAEAAARHYFGKSAADLGPYEGAQLAASLSRPSRWHPGVESSGYRRRVELIARRSRKASWLEGEL